MPTEICSLIQALSSVVSGGVNGEPVDAFPQVETAIDAVEIALAIRKR